MKKFKCRICKLAIVERGQHLWEIEKGEKTTHYHSRCYFEKLNKKK
jgi:hypothetical protein